MSESANPLSCSPVLKMVAVIVGALSLEVMLIFIVLKLDAQTAVAHWVSAKI